MTNIMTTSAGTSLNQVPALFKSPVFHEAANSGNYYGIFDIGAGKYNKAFDYILNHFDGIQYMPFDPYNRPVWENEASEDLAQAALDMGFSLIVTCSNVLNVIDGELTDIIKQAAEYAGNKGIALFKVYEGTGYGIGRYTCKGYQRNQKMAYYIPFIRKAFVHVEKCAENIIKAW